MRDTVSQAHQQQLILQVVSEKQVIVCSVPIHIYLDCNDQLGCPGDLNPRIYSDCFLYFFLKVCKQPLNHLMMTYKYCPAGKTIEADPAFFCSCVRALFSRMIIKMFQERKSNIQQQTQMVAKDENESGADLIGISEGV